MDRVGDISTGHIHNIVFGQLGSFTPSMFEFEVSLSHIASFVETMCDAHKLTEIKTSSSQHEHIPRN